MIYRALDIETVPDHSSWNPPEKWKLAPLGGEGTFDPKTKETRARPGLVLDDPFPPPNAHRVVAISWLDLHAGVSNPQRYHYRDFGAVCSWSHGQPDECEEQLLQDFYRAMHDDGGDSANVMLITWNGRRFDLPVLSMRSMKQRVPFSWYYQNDDVRYRYKEEGHTDLMDYLSDYGSAPAMKLGDIARMIGLPGKVGMDGGGVAELHAKGDDVETMAKVRRYCLSDVLQTALVYLRTVAHLGRIDSEQHDLALSSIRESTATKASGLNIDWNRLVLSGPS
jgi:predicted PolB exonuclease-like 3'-5' exonuclease